MHRATLQCYQENNLYVYIGQWVRCSLLRWSRPLAREENIKKWKIWRGANDFQLRNLRSFSWPIALLKTQPIARTLRIRATGSRQAQPHARSLLIKGYLH